MQIPFLSTIRPVMYDEAWYSSTGYNVYIGNGFLNSIVGSGGNANIVLPFLVGVSFNLFGVSLLSARIVAVVCGLVTIIFIYKSNRLLNVSTTANTISLLLFVSLTIFNTIFRFARPECASVMFCVIGAFIFIKILRSNSWYNIVYLSLTAYLAIISHPFSILLFAIFGIYLLLFFINKKSFVSLAFLTCLLIAAILGLFTIIYVSVKYNFVDSNVATGIETRTILNSSMKEIQEGLKVYIKTFFVSRHAIYSYVCLFFLACGAIKNDNYTIKAISICTLLFFFFFPLFFPSDLAMIGLSLDYVMAMELVVFASIFDTIYNNSQHKKTFIYSFYAYCLINFVVTISFNASKYSNDNDLLYKDVHRLIPSDSMCFGSIRQWFLVPETNFISDHYRGVMPPYESFDYLIINSVDENNPKYTHYNFFEDKSSYELIYSKDTKQYGVVSVYKNIKFRD